jgi:hypothetical protein
MLLLHFNYGSTGGNTLRQMLMLVLCWSTPLTRHDSRHHGLCHFGRAPRGALQPAGAGCGVGGAAVGPGNTGGRALVVPARCCTVTHPRLLLDTIWQVTEHIRHPLLQDVGVGACMLGTWHAGVGWSVTPHQHMLGWTPGIATLLMSEAAHCTVQPAA